MFPGLRTYDSQKQKHHVNNESFMLYCLFALHRCATLNKHLHYSDFIRYLLPHELPSAISVALYSSIEKQA